MPSIIADSELQSNFDLFLNILLRQDVIDIKPCFVHPVLPTYLLLLLLVHSFSVII